MIQIYEGRYIVEVTLIAAAEEDMQTIENANRSFFGPVEKI